MKMEKYRRRMVIKKAIRNVCLLIMLFLSSSLLGACCSMDIEATVNFIGVDSELDYESYIQKLDIGESLDISLSIPEGFDHEGFEVFLEDKAISYEVTYDDPNIEEQYRYSTGKTITFSVSKAIGDFTLNIDMTSVTRKAFTINFSNGLVDGAKTEKSNKKGEYDSNLYAVSIDPDKLDRLTRLDSSNVLAVREVVGNKVTVYYDEYVALCYVKSSGKSNFSTFYTDVNHFTDSSDILTLGNINYCKYDVTMSGNNYYHLYDYAINSSSSRLYYIGRIQESFNIYEKIPTYVAPQGFTLDDEENKFSLLTNLHEYNSDMLTIKIFAPAGDTYTDEQYQSSDNLDKMGNITAIELSPNGVEHNRYDRYDMYIGNDISSDKYIYDSERGSLPSKLYIVVESEVGVTVDDLGNRLHFCLLHYEKMSSTVPHLIFSNILETDKGKIYFEIDKDVVSSYIDNKIDPVDGTQYKTGNAIIYFTLSSTWLEHRNESTFPYTSINYRLYTDGTFLGLNDGYKFALYIRNEDGTKDYGLIDKQAYAEEIVYLRTDKLFSYDDDLKKWVYNNNLYFDLEGKEYKTVYNEIIHDITATTNQFTGSAIKGSTIKVENPIEFNGLNGIEVYFPGRYVLDQLTLNIYMNVSDYSSSDYQVKFSKSIFTLENGETSNGTILMTNNIEFEDSSDFVKMLEYNAERTDSISINFGNGKEIYFFTTDSNLNFDVYIGSDENKVSSVKELKDILGKNIYVTYNNKNYKVYVMYQSVDIYFDSNYKVEYYGK